MRLPTAQESYNTARHFGAALGCNVIPCTVDTRAALVKWAAYNGPGSARVSEGTYTEWAALAASRERRGVPTAWAVLPGSGRLAAFDVDEPAQVVRLQELHGTTPLVVRSPNAGHAHLYFQWPRGADVGSVSQEALPGYAVKARGSMIHCPGSLHKSGAGWYTASLPPAEWRPGLRDRLPELDMAALDGDRLGRMNLDGLAGRPASWAAETEAVRRGVAWLATAEHAVGGRENKTYHAAHALGDFGVPLEIAERLIIEWDGRAAQPRGAVAVSETVRRAYGSRRLAAGCRRFGDTGEVDAEALLAAFRSRASALASWNPPATP